MKIAIGIDVGGTNIKYGIFTESGRLIHKLSHPTKKVENRCFFSQIADTVEKMIKELEKKGNSILGVGLGMPGPVEGDGFIEKCVNIGLKNINPTQIVSEKLHGLPCIIANDANVAALGEMWKGSAKGYKNIVVITLGTGVGGGVILNGRILCGSNGLAGEIGHVIVNPNEKERCNCGKYGCLDQVASATGIVRIARKALSFTNAPSILRESKHLTAKLVTESAKKGDVLSYMILDYCMSFLGKSLAEISHILDPQILVIGGGVSQAGSILIDMIERHYKKNVTLIKMNTPIVSAELGNDAGIYGAAKMVFDMKQEEKGERRIC